ncbi:hypothetical protein EDB19DRAFT_171123 [Suillus lakei]|nr:hypothetical protein EDB19DRAFT_171123 [Suillus lakei]
MRPVQQLRFLDLMAVPHYCNRWSLPTGARCCMILPFGYPAILTTYSKAMKSSRSPTRMQPTILNPHCDAGAFVGFAGLSPVSLVSTSPAPSLHWQLLSHHLARPNLFLYFDVAFPIHDIEYRQNSTNGVQRIPLSDADLDKPAGDKKSTKMTINFHRELFEWDIDVERDEGIRVRDVFDAIYKAFDVPLTNEEKDLLSPHFRAQCEQASRLRCNLAPVPPTAQFQQRDWNWKRVDVLLYETIFRGLTQSKSGGYWTLNLSRMVSKAIERSRIISDHIAADPTVLGRVRGLLCDPTLDLETTLSNSPPPLPVLELSDEYLLPYPNQIPNAPPEYYNIDLFNLPLSADFASAPGVDHDVLFPACRICNFMRLSPILQHGTLCTLLNHIPTLIMEPSSQDYTWAFFCRFVPLCALFDSPSRGPLPMIQLGSDCARLIERLEADTENPKNAISWLHGPSGTGKSVIAYALASRCRQKHRLAGSFFFSRRHANCRSARSVVFALAYQLGLCQLQAKEKIIAALDSDPGLISPSRDLREQFARLLIEPLEAVDWRSPSRVFVIDAMDQCQDQVPELISLLTRLLSHMVGVGLHIVFTSRDHVEGVLIKRHLFSMISDIALDHTGITKDIRSFLRQSFDKIHKRHRLQCRKPWPPEEVLGRLVDRVGPHFITGSIIVKFIESLDHDPTDRMDLIDHTPFNPSSPSESSVDDFYKSIISTADDLEQAYLHLTIVVNLAGVLSYSQLNDLLTRAPNQKFDMRSVLSQLSPLVHIPDGHDSAVRVCHESLCDFLSDPLRCGNQFISQAQVHHLLAYSSLSVMIEELPNHRALCSRLSQLLMQSGSVSLRAFDNADVLSFAINSPPEPLPFLSMLWHITRRQYTGFQADPRTKLALLYFCRTWQILQHLDLSAVDTLPAFRFLANIRSLPALLAFPIFLAFESPRSGQTLGPSTLEYDPRIETLDAVAEIVTDVHALKDQRNTGSVALDYACTHWAYHLSLAEWDDDLRSILTAFMKQKLQQWLVQAWCLQDLETCLRTLCEVRELYLTANPSIRVDPDAQHTDANTDIEEEEAEGTPSAEAILQNIQESADASNRSSMEQAGERVDEAIADTELERKAAANHAFEITAGKEDVEILSDVDTDSS